MFHVDSATSQRIKPFFRFLEKFLILGCGNEMVVDSLFWEVVLILALSLKKNKKKLSVSRTFFNRALLLLNLAKFLKNFIDDFQNFHKVFPNIPPFFFFKISINITQNSYYLLSFAVFSRQFLSPSLIFYQFFCKFLKLKKNIYLEFQ